MAQPKSSMAKLMGHQMAVAVGQKVLTSHLDNKKRMIKDEIQVIESIKREIGFDIIEDDFVKNIQFRFGLEKQEKVV